MGSYFTAPTRLFMQPPVHPPFWFVVLWVTIVFDSANVWIQAKFCNRQKNYGHQAKKNEFWKFFDNTWWKWLSSLFIKKYACRKAIWRKCNFFKSAFLIYMEICLFWSSMQLFIMCLNEKPCCFQRKKHYQHAWKMSET